MPVEEVAVEAGHAAGAAHGLDAVVHFFFFFGGGGFFLFLFGCPQKLSAKVREVVSESFEPPPLLGAPWDGGGGGGG